MANFDPNAILRGAQLTVVGAYRALQNPRLFTSGHYRQAALAIAAAIAIRIVVVIPIIGVRIVLKLFGLFVDLGQTHWPDEIIDGLTFIQHHVLQAPFFLMSLMRYISPTLDGMFMESLDWVDKTYTAKHRSDDPTKLRAMYFDNLRLYPTSTRHGKEGLTWSNRNAIIAFMMRYGRKAGLSLTVYALSHIPYVGRVILPAASFYTFHKAVGTQPAIIIFGTGLLLPKRYLITFLQSYFSSRSLMRELLDPYFSRIHYSKDQKRQWFHDREGVLFGFAVGFFVFLKIPLLGVLVYGIAEASTAFLLTKITDPPPPPEQAKEYAEGQIRWTNKQKFLSLPLERLDALNVQLHRPAEKTGLAETEPSRNKFS